MTTPSFVWRASDTAPDARKWRHLGPCEGPSGRRWLGRLGCEVSVEVTSTALIGAVLRQPPGAQRGGGELKKNKKNLLSFDVLETNYDGGKLVLHDKSQGFQDN